MMSGTGPLPYPTSHSVRSRWEAVWGSGPVPIPLMRKTL